MKLYRFLILVFCLCSLGACVAKKDKQVKPIEESDGTILGRWKVISMNERIKQTSVNAPATYVVDVTTDTTYRVELDINTCGGTYRLDANGTIEMEEQVFCTRACCDSDYAIKLIEVMGKSTSYSCTEKELRLLGEGQIILSREQQSK